MLTPLETSGTQTSRAAGETFLADLAAATDITLTDWGDSVNGNPMTSATIGAGPVRVCVLGAIHGDEPAGREAAFIFLRDLAETADSSLLSYLAGAAWSFMPTGNPDQIDARVRRNINGIDLNRDHHNRTQPETQAIYDWLQACKPVLVLDLHEMSSVPSDIALGVQERTDIHPDLRTQSGEVRDEVVSQLTAAGVTVAEYPHTPETEGTMRNEAGRIHKAAALLVESHRGVTLSLRATRHCIALAAARDHHESDAAAYEAARIAAGGSPIINRRRGSSVVGLI